MLRKMKALGHTHRHRRHDDRRHGLGDARRSGSQECAGRRAILQLDVRENLDLGDCRIEDTFENRCKVAAMIRRHRPQIVMAPYYNLPIGRGLGHNDHYKTGQIVANAYNLAHLRKAPIEGEPHQAKAIYFYFLPPGTRAHVHRRRHRVTSTTGSRRSTATRASSTTRTGRGPEHLPSVRDVFESFARYWGWQIGVKYGQAYLATSPAQGRRPDVAGPGRGAASVGAGGVVAAVAAGLPIGRSR